MGLVDWTVLIATLLTIVIYGSYKTKKNSNIQSFLKANNSTGWFTIGLSVMATQASAITFLSTPGQAYNDGMGFIQFYFGLPLAMIIICVFFVPLYHKLKVYTAYEFLEKRFDRKTRVLGAMLFLIQRGLAAGITIFAPSIILSTLLNIDLKILNVIIGFLVIIYTIAGGTKAVNVTQKQQMFVIFLGLFFVFFILIGSYPENFSVDKFLDYSRASNKLNILDFSLDYESRYTFWSGITGGLFLALSYFGTDQSQVQRGLCARSQSDAQKILVLNGIFRFPFVLLYCLIGVGLANYASDNAVFFEQLSVNGKDPNFNLEVPVFFLNELPIGMLGLSLVALLAAAMSSLDSVINSLSAVSMEDFVKSTSWGNTLSDQQELWLCRCFTIIWGGMAVSGSFWVGDIASTVIVAVNKIGSVTNGPVLAVFVIGLLSRKTTGTGVVLGFFVGIFVNITLWQIAPNVSWLWWNVFGFAGTFLTALLVAQLNPKRKVVGEADKILFWSWVRYKNLSGAKALTYSFYFLIFYTAILIMVLAFFNLASN